MGRLTEHHDYCFMACYEQQGDKIREECPIYRNCYSRQMHEKLSHYEDLEEQGRLIELPCKVGDTVYVVDFTRAGYRIFEANIEEVRCQSYATYYCLDWGLQPQRFRAFKEDNLGKNVFLTKEEAEAKLKELKEGAK